MEKLIKNFREWSRSRSSFNLNESVQFPTDHDEIEQILKDYDIKKYSIKDDGTVDVDGNVLFEYCSFNHIPVKFKIVNGDFEIINCVNLKTLIGAPKKCIAFSCEECLYLESLEGAPKECIHFSCNRCENLLSLEGAPEECEIFDCAGCTSLTDLEGAPKECETFYGMFNNINTLYGFPKKCDIIYIDYCINLETLEGTPKKCSHFSCYNCNSLEYSLKYFPKANRVDIEGTCFEKLYDAIGEDNFIRLMNTDSKSEFDDILAIGYSRGLDFEEHIKPLLKDKTMAEEAFKHKYRGAIAGERFRF